MIVSEDEFDCLNLIYLKKRLRHPRSCDPPTEIPGSPRSRSIIGPVGRNAVTPTRESVPIPAESSPKTHDSRAANSCRRSIPFLQTRRNRIRPSRNKSRAHRRLENLCGIRNQSRRWRCRAPKGELREGPEQTSRHRSMRAFPSGARWPKCARH